MLDWAKSGEEATTGPPAPELDARYRSKWPPPLDLAGGVPA